MGEAVGVSACITCSLVHNRSPAPTLSALLLTTKAVLMSERHCLPRVGLRGRDRLGDRQPPGSVRRHPFGRFGATGQ